MQKEVGKNRFKGIIGQSVEEKNLLLMQAINNKITVDNWQEIVAYIMKYQKEVSQCELLVQCLAVMNQINYEVMDDLSRRLQRYFYYSQSLLTTLILAKYILNYEFSGSRSLVEKQYRAAVKTYGLFTNELKAMENVGVETVNLIHIQDIQTSMQIIPNLYKKCDISNLDPKHLESMLRWVCVVSIDSFEGTIRTGKFCEFITKIATDQGKSEKSRVQPTSKFIYSIIECSKLKLHNKCNLTFLIDCIPVKLLAKSIQNYTVFEDTRVQTYIQFWQSILSVGASVSTIKFIFQVCVQLEIRSKIQDLIQVYVSIVVRIIFRRFKFSRTAQQQIQILTTLFMDEMPSGFPNNQETVDAILEDFDRLDNSMKCFWSSVIIKIKLTINSDQPTLQRQQPSQPSRQSDFQGLKWIKYNTHQTTNPGACTLIKSVLNILFTSGHLRELLRSHCQKTKYVVQELYRQVHSVFSLMDKGKAEQVESFVDKIYSLTPRPERHSSVTHWLKFILTVLGHQFLSNQSLTSCYKSMFGVEVSFSYQCPKCLSQNTQMVEQNLVTLDYGVALNLEMDFLHECNRCRNVSFNKKSILIIPDTIVVCYNSPAQKNPERFPIPRYFGNHILTHIQFYTISECGRTIHIFCRNMQFPKYWFHFDGENLKQMEMTSPNEPFQTKLGPEYLVQTFIYQQVPR